MAELYILAKTFTSLIRSFYRQRKLFFFRLNHLESFEVLYEKNWIFLISQTNFNLRLLFHSIPKTFECCFFLPLLLKFQDTCFYVSGIESEVLSLAVKMSFQHNIVSFLAGGKTHFMATLFAANLIMFATQVEEIGPVYGPLSGCSITGCILT